MSLSQRHAAWLDEQEQATAAVAFAAGRADRQPEIDSCTARVKALESANAGLRDELQTAEAERDAIRAAYAEHMATHHAPPVPPFGVTAHSSYRRHPLYSDHDLVYDKVIECGASYMRDRLAHRNPAQAALWARLREAGVGIHATVGAPWTAPDERPALAAALHDRAASLVEVAGYNEPDGAGDPDWLARTADHQAWLHQTVRADPALAHVRVCAPVLRDRNRNLAADLAALYAAIDGSYDVANLHAYPHGGPPEDYLAGRLAMLPDGPFVVSEGGFNTGLEATSGGNPVTEETQASLSVRYVRTAHEQGGVLYLYELFDDGTSPTEWTAHWGLFRHDTTPKPVVGALTRGA